MAVTRREFMTAAAAAAAGAAITRSAGARDEERSPKRQRRVLILGGTGFLGPHLVDELRRRNHLVTLFNRGTTAPHLFPDVETLLGDRDGGLKVLENRKWDALIDTSGYVPRVVGASARLLAPSVQQYVFVSTISVYADNSRVGMDENSPLMTLPPDKADSEDVPSFYGALKALSEVEVERAMPGRVTIVRPGLIVGPRDPTDRFTYWPVRLARGGEVLAPGSLQDPVQFIDVRDLAEFIVHGVEHGAFGTYNVMGPERHLGIGTLLDDCRLVTMPATLTWADAAFLEKHDVQPWSDMPVWAPPEGENGGFGQMSNRRALEAGLRFRPVVTTCKDTLAWFRRQPPERQASLRAGIKPEREMEVLKHWHEATDKLVAKEEPPKPPKKGYTIAQPRKPSQG